MQCTALVLVGCLLASSVTWADPPSGTTSTSPAVAHLNQRIARHQAEVDHLQKDVGQQESASQQAAERLQQQDRTIAELRQQLKATQNATKAPVTGH
jgi:septal ring factor EnvC (AmiA/AmiB activator)